MAAIEEIFELAYDSRRRSFLTCLHLFFRSRTDVCCFRQSTTFDIRKTHERYTAIVLLLCCSVGRHACTTSTLCSSGALHVRLCIIGLNQINTAVHSRTIPGHLCLLKGRELQYCSVSIACVHVEALKSFRRTRPVSSCLGTRYNSACPAPHRATPALGDLDIPVEPRLDHLIR